MESSPEDAAELLSALPDALIDVCSPRSIRSSLAGGAAAHFPRARRELILAAAARNIAANGCAMTPIPEDCIGRLMEPALAVCQPDATIGEATERVRSLVTRAFITYIFVVDAEERLLGVVAMREMLLGRPDQTLEEIMIQDPFALRPEMDLTDAMKATVTRHFPVYPVVDGTGRLVGVVARADALRGAGHRAQRPGRYHGRVSRRRNASPRTGCAA